MTRSATQIHPRAGDPTYFRVFILITILSGLGSNQAVSAVVLIPYRESTKSPAIHVSLPWTQSSQVSLKGHSQAIPSFRPTPLLVSPQVEPTHDNMTDPIETLTQHLIRRATEPSSLALLTAVASSSFFFFGNLGLALNGVFPATITKSERTRNGVSEESALKLWEWAYPRARVRLQKESLPPRYD